MARWQEGKGSAEIADAANTAFTLYFLMAAVVTAAGFLFAPQVLMLVQTPREAYDHALIYLRVMFLGIVFLFGYNLIGALQRGLGDSLSSLRYVVTAAVVNIALDYLLVGRLSMGTGGAAAATVAAQMVSLFYGTVGVSDRRSCNQASYSEYGIQPAPFKIYPMVWHSDRV